MLLFRLCKHHLKLGLWGPLCVCNAMDMLYLSGTVGWRDPAVSLTSWACRAASFHPPSCFQPSCLLNKAREHLCFKNNLTKMGREGEDEWTIFSLTKSLLCTAPWSCPDATRRGGAKAVQRELGNKWPDRNCLFQVAFVKNPTAMSLCIPWGCSEHGQWEVYNHIKAGLLLNQTIYCIRIYKKAAWLVFELHL